MGRLLRRVETLVPRRAQGYGGKARNLAMLARAGFPVPAAYALPGRASAEFLRATLPPEDQPVALLAESPAEVSPERLEAIRETVLSAPMPAALARALTEVHDVLKREGAQAVAVRSSSTREDQGAAAAAGLHATHLNVVSAEEVLSAVQNCWASLFSPRVFAYLRTMPGGSPDAAVGVVIQAMVPAEASGVLFTVNPLTGDAGEVVINATWGLGCGLVEGRVSPDTWRLDKATRSVRDRVLGDKARRWDLASGGGVEEHATAAPDRARFCLDESAVDELLALGIRLEDQAGDARDVEWAIADGQIYLLQARPVTTAVHPPSRSRPRRRLSGLDRSRIVWSNVNVGEALPGAATPLTWSVASGFSEVGFRRAFGAVGCPVPRDAELVGNFRGRIYLNLTEIMNVLAQVPGLTPRTLLSLGGGGEIDRLEHDVEHRSPIGFLARLPITLARFGRENFQIRSRVAAFEKSFLAERRRLGSLDFRVLSPTALDKTLYDIERLLDQAGLVMLTAYGNLLLTVVLLRTTLSIVAGTEAERLQRDLLTGLADVDSAAPGIALFHIAEMASVDEPVRDVILESDPAHLRLADLPDGPTKRALHNFIEAHGFRGTREAEIAEPRWREDPTLLFTTLALHLTRSSGRERPIDIEHRQRRIREQAEAELDRLLPIPARAAIRHLLALVQRLTRLRERLRAHVVEVLGVFRRVALDASRRIQRREPELGAGAAFFLTLDELHAVLRGEIQYLSTTVRQRRRQYERDRALPDPPDTFVGFPPPAPLPPPGTDALSGLGASSGYAEGTARVLRTPQDAALFRAGEVLVAHCADVGWSPLFLVAGAVVTDLGGPLSHASIVLREFGVPAVVNVKCGTQVIRTGDRVVVDADAGTVRVVSSADEGASVRTENADAGS